MIFSFRPLILCSVNSSNIVDQYYYCKSLNLRQPPIMGIVKIERINETKNKEKWMRRASIPLPIPCEGITLPFELHTLVICSPFPSFKYSQLLFSHRNAGKVTSIYFPNYFTLFCAYVVVSWCCYCSTLCVHYSPCTSSENNLPITDVVLSVCFVCYFLIVA